MASQQLIKRLVDLNIALGSIVVLAQLLLLIAGLIRLTMGKPVLFRQQRAGWKGKVFTLHKFRTMHTAAVDNQGAPTADGQRLTKLGRFLRATSLDELPE